MTNCGNALSDAGEFARAVASYEKAIVLLSRWAELKEWRYLSHDLALTLMNKGDALTHLGKSDWAVEGDSINIIDRLKRWLFGNAESELQRAISENDPQRVSALLAQGANANLRDRRGQTPLFLAVDSSTNRAITEELLVRGADVNVRDRKGRTPLHAAVVAGNEDCLWLFLEHGADINARDNRGQTPLHYAAYRGGNEVADFLVGRGADVSLRDHKGRTPLDLARANPEPDPWLAERQEMMERLLGGFMTARIVEAQPETLVVQVETVHWTREDAYREATKRGTLPIPSGAFLLAPTPGDVIRCHHYLSGSLHKAWKRQMECQLQRDAEQHDIEREC